jgi:hypothetical protein
MAIHTHVQMYVNLPAKHVDAEMELVVIIVTCAGGLALQRSVVIVENPHRIKNLEKHSIANKNKLERNKNKLEWKTLTGSNTLKGSKPQRNKKKLERNKNKLMWQTLTGSKTLRGSKPQRNKNKLQSSQK